MMTAEKTPILRGKSMELLKDLTHILREIIGSGDEARLYDRWHLIPDFCHRVPFSSAGSAKSVWISARPGALAHSLGPTASATGRPSRPIRNVVGRPITP